MIAFLEAFFFMTVYPLKKHIKKTTTRYIKNKPISILIKGGATFSSLYFLRKAKAGDKKVAFVSLGFLNILYGLVVRNNFNVLVQLGR